MLNKSAQVDKNEKEENTESETTEKKEDEKEEEKQEKVSADKKQEGKIDNAVWDALTAGHSEAKLHKLKSNASLDESAAKKDDEVFLVLHNIYYL